LRGEDAARAATPGQDNATKCTEVSAGGWNAETILGDNCALTARRRRVRCNAYRLLRRPHASRNGADRHRPHFIDRLSSTRGIAAAWRWHIRLPPRQCAGAYFQRSASL